MRRADSCPKGHFFQSRMTLLSWVVSHFDHGLVTRGPVMNRFVLSLFATSISFYSTSGAMAQTISYADAVGQVAVACKADIAKYCAKTTLGGGELLQCLNQTPGVWQGCK